MMWLLLLADVDLEVLARAADECGINVLPGMSRGEVLLLADLLMRTDRDRAYLLSVAMNPSELSRMAERLGVAGTDGVPLRLVRRLRAGRRVPNTWWVHQIRSLSKRADKRSALGVTVRNILLWIALRNTRETIDVHADYLSR